MDSWNTEHLDNTSAHSAQDGEVKDIYAVGYIPEKDEDSVFEKQWPPVVVNAIDNNK